MKNLRLWAIIWLLTSVVFIIFDKGETAIWGSLIISAIFNVGHEIRQPSGERE